MLTEEYMRKRRKHKPRPIRIVASEEPRMTSYSPIGFLISKKNKAIAQAIYERYPHFRQYDCEFFTPLMANQMNKKELKRYKKFFHLPELFGELEDDVKKILFEHTFSVMLLEEVNYEPV
jgi:hypothetical protein